MTVSVFVGPSSSLALRREDGVVLHPPARHGDLWRLGPAAGDVVVVIDGVYQQHAPLRHQEILWALRLGVRVVGAASYGALRAAELAPYGMEGVGRVAAAYANGELTSDADVAVLHAADEPTRRLSLAAVTVRFQCRDLVADGRMSADEAHLVEQCSDALHFTERTESALRLAVPRSAEHAIDVLVEHLAAGGDVKEADALAAVRWARSRVASTPHAVVTPSAEESGFTAEERFRLQPVAAGGRATGREVLACLQLFDREFPERQRRYVLDVVGMTDAADVLAAAGFAGEGIGVHPFAAPTTCTAGWTPAERVLVRNFRLVPGRLVHTGLDAMLLGHHDLGELARHCDIHRRARLARRSETARRLAALLEAADEHTIRLGVLDRGFRDTEEAMLWLAAFEESARDLPGPGRDGART